MSIRSALSLTAIALVLLVYIGYRDVKSQAASEITEDSIREEAKKIRVDKSLVVHKGDTWSLCEPTSTEGSSGFKLLWPTKNCKSEDDPILAGGPRHMTHVKSADGSAMYFILWYNRPEGSSKDPYGEVLLPAQDGSQSGMKGSTVTATRQFKIGDMPCLDYTLKMNSRVVSRDRACLFQGRQLFVASSYQPTADIDNDYVSKYYESLTKL